MHEFRVLTYSECKCVRQMGKRYTQLQKNDIQSLLQIYEGIFTKSGLEKLTGIHQKQLWHYAMGQSKPRAAQRMKIENALHRLGNELISLSFQNI